MFFVGWWLLFPEPDCLSLLFPEMAPPERAAPQQMQSFRFEQFPSDGTVHWDTYGLAWDFALLTTSVGGTFSEQIAIQRSGENLGG